MNGICIILRFFRLHTVKLLKNKYMLNDNIIARKINYILILLYVATHFLI